MIILQILAMAACLAASPMTACNPPPAAAATLEEALHQAGAALAVGASPEWGRSTAGQPRPLVVPRWRGRLPGAGNAVSLAFAPRPVWAEAAEGVPLHLEAVLSLAASSEIGPFLVRAFGPPSLSGSDDKAGTVLLWCEHCGGLTVAEALRRCRAAAGFPLLEDVAAVCGRTMGAVWRPDRDGRVRLTLWADEHGLAGDALRMATAGIR